MSGQLVPGHAVDDWCEGQTQGATEEKGADSPADVDQSGVRMVAGDGWVAVHETVVGDDGREAGGEMGVAVSEGPHDEGHAVVVGPVPLADDQDGPAGVAVEMADAGDPEQDEYGEAEVTEEGASAVMLQFFLQQTYDGPWNSHCRW